MLREIYTPAARFPPQIGVPFTGLIWRPSYSLRLVLYQPAHAILLASRLTPLEIYTWLMGPQAKFIGSSRTLRPNPTPRFSFPACRAPMDSRSIAMAIFGR